MEKFYFCSDRTNTYYLYSNSRDLGQKKGITFLCTKNKGVKYLLEKNRDGKLIKIGIAFDKNIWTEKGALDWVAIHNMNAS